MATEAPAPGRGAPGYGGFVLVQSLSLQQITYLIAGVGVVGVLLWRPVSSASVRARRKPAARVLPTTPTVPAGEDDGRRRRGLRR